MARSCSTGNTMAAASAAFTAYPFTMLALGKATAGSTLLIVDDGTTTNRFQIDSTPGTNCRLVAQTAAGAQVAAASASPSSGAWFSHTGVGASATSRAAFLDGANKGTNSTSRTPTGLANTRMGKTTAADDTASTHAERAVVSSAMADADVATLMTPRSGGYIRPILARLLGYTVTNYWPIYGVDSPEPDLVGGVNMALTGTPAQATHPPIYDTRRHLLRARHFGCA